MTIKRGDKCICRPQFKENAVFLTSIEENAPIGSIVPLPYPLATDADSGKFGKITYFLVNNNETFNIDKDSSELRIAKTLDFERERSYSLTIRALDNVANRSSISNEAFASVDRQQVEL